MRAHAIVIGIDDYADPAMVLRSAVADACRFAAWALVHGGVEPSGLTLLLAPTAAQAAPPLPPGVEQYRPATRDSINAVLAEYTNDQRGRGAERLYVYFAGHGLAGAAATHVAASEPVLVPSDYVNPSRSQHLLLRFSDVFSVLRQHLPREQLFFFDACRDYAPESLLPAPGQTAIYVPPPSPGVQAEQCALYGTSLGRKANEHEGQGMFTGALLEALVGHHVELTYSYDRQRYELRFDELASAVIGVVRRRAGGIQIPEPRSFGSGGLVVVGLDMTAVPIVDVDLIVQPGDLGSSCAVEVLEFSRARRDLVVTERLTVDGNAQASLTLQPGTYPLRIKGDGCSGVYSLKVAGGRPGRQREVVRVERNEPAAPIGLESLGVELESLHGGSTASSQRARQPAEPATTGTLVVRCADRGVDIALARSGVWLARARGELRMDGLDPGVYVVLVELSEEFVRHEPVVLAGAVTTYDVELPAARFGQTERTLLAALGVTIVDGLVHVDGVDSPLAAPRMSEVLALVANCAETLAATSGTRIVIMVACPDDHDALARVGVALEGLNNAWRIVLSASPGSIGGYVTLQSRVLPGPLEVRLDLPGLVQASFAAVAVAERTVVVVIVLMRHAAGRAALVHIAHVGQGVTSDLVRAFDRAQHALRSNATLPPAFVRAAAEGVAEAPLFALLAAVSADPDAMTSERASIAATLSKDPCFAETADVALLQGSDTADRFAVTARAAQQQPRVLGRELLPSASWAMWVHPRPSLRVTRGDTRFDAAPASWQIIDERRRRVEAAIPAVGIALRAGAPCGTAFLVRPDEVITASFVADETLGAGTLSFDFGGRVFAAVAILHLDPQSYVARVRLSAQVSAVPLEVAPTTPSLDRPRAGYLLAMTPYGRDTDLIAPSLTINPGLMLLRRPAAGIRISGVPQAGPAIHDVLIHDCAGEPGSAGAPLIDLDSGRVVALHHSVEFGMVRVGVATVLSDRMADAP